MHHGEQKELLITADLAGFVHFYDSANWNSEDKLDIHQKGIKALYHYGNN